MRLRAGYELRYEFPQPTPIILTLNVHFTRVSDLETPDHIIVSPSVPISGYRDGFGNWCSRLVAPVGGMTITTDFVIKDSGLPDPQVSDAWQVPVEELPEETLVFLLASRFCDSDRLLDLAWTLFGKAVPGLGRVQAICDFVHQRIAFGYEHARPTRTASEAYQECHGVCRDYAHLGDCVLQGFEHAGSLLYGLSRRCRHGASLSARRFRRMVRGLSRRPLAWVRPAEQYSSHRPNSHSAWPRRRRRRHGDDFRSEYASQLSRLDGRGSARAVMARFALRAVSSDEEWTFARARWL